MPSEFFRWVIIDVDGKEYEITPKNWKNCKVWRNSEKYQNLKCFVRNELVGKPKKKEEPKHIEYMKKLELVDYCPESDLGHMKWYPNGVLIKDLLLDYAQKLALEWGAVKIKTPLIYRTSVKEIKELMKEFMEREYLLKYDKKELVLRFASDPGVFPFIKKMLYSYNQLPLKVYEEAMCFRREQSGELLGLARVRSFIMSDMHGLYKDEESAKKEFKDLCLKFKKIMETTISKDWAFGWEVVEEYFEKYKKLFKEIIREIDMPGFFKIMKKMWHYYAFKNEFQAISPDGNNVQISTVQWDVKNGKRFGFEYVGKDNKKHNIPIIIHASSFGSIERALASMLEYAGKMEKKGFEPMLPVWLSPEQVRILPVADRHLKFAEELADELEKEGIRVGIDDRSERIPKKVHDAKMRWIPFIIVVGDRDLQGEKLNIVFREDAKLMKENIKKMTKDEFIKMFKERYGDFPKRPLYIPRLLSKRPIFVAWSDSR